MKFNYFFAVSALALAGCGHHASAPASAANASVTTQAGTAVPVTPPASAASALPQPDQTIALTSYVAWQPLDIPSMYMYLSKSDNYASFSTVMDPQYSMAQDVPQKQAALKVDTAKVQALIQTFASKRYFVEGQPTVTDRLDSINDAVLDHYDPTRGGFPVELRGLSSQSASGVGQSPNDYYLHFTNSQDFAFIPVKDLATAKQIEAVVSKFTAVDVVPYSYAQAASKDVPGFSGKRVVQAKIVAVQLVNSLTGQVYATYKP